MNKDQKILLKVLMTPDGNTLKSIYFKVALFRGVKKVSMEDLMDMVGVPALICGGCEVYEKGQKDKVTSVDKQLQNEFEAYKKGLIFFSDRECDLLRRIGSSVQTVTLNTMG